MPQTRAQRRARYQHEATKRIGVYALKVLPDGRLVGLVNNHTIKVWSKTGACVLTLTTEFTVSSYNLELLSAGRLVSYYDDPSLRLYDLADGSLLHTLQGHTEEVQCVKEIPEEDRIVSGSFDHTIRLWELAGGTCVLILNGHLDSVWSVAILSDGRLASGSHDQTLKLWDLTDGSCVKTLTEDSETHFVSDLSSGFFMYADESALKVRDLAECSCLHTLSHESSLILCVFVLPCGRRVVSGDDDETIYVWDAIAGHCLHRLPADIPGDLNPDHSVAILPDGNIVYVAEYNTLKVFDITNGRCIQELSRSSSCITAVAAMPDGRVVAGYSCFDYTEFSLHVWADSHREREKLWARQLARQRACGDVAQILELFV